MSLISGDVAAVRSAVNHAVDTIGFGVIDHFVIPNVHKTIFPAISGHNNVQLLESLGIVESYSVASLIEGADAAVKAANITLGDWVKVGGGKVSIIVRGDVASVKAAVEAGVQAAAKIGTVESEVVISRPSDKLMPKFPLEPVKKAAQKKSTK